MRIDEHPIEAPRRENPRGRTLASVSSFLLLAMVLHSFAAVCEAVQIAPLTGDRITVRYLSAALVRGVERVVRRTNENPDEAVVTHPVARRPWGRVVRCRSVVAGQRDSRHADHHLTRFELSLPPPALA